MNVVIFGAGNVGRGFLAEVIQNNEYKITFVDVNEELTNLLASKNEYTIKYASEKDEEIMIRNFDVINLRTNPEIVISAIKESDLILTAIGVKLLSTLNHFLEQGLNAKSKWTTIIACENGIRASSQWKATFKNPFKNQNIQMIDAIVDRIVPNIQSNTLDVIVEKYWSIVLDKKQMVMPIAINGCQFVDELDSYIERKIFLLNSLHVYTAWQGMMKNIVYIHEAINEKSIYKNVLQLGEELMNVLVAKHNFNKEELNEYLNDVFKRFKNKKLNDTCLRVGAAPIRKLSPNERFITPYLFAIQNNINADELKKAIALGFAVKNDSDFETKQLQKLILEKGVKETFSEITKLDPNKFSPLI